MDRSQRVTLDAAEPEGSHWVKRARELLGSSLARAWPLKEPIPLRGEDSLPIIRDDLEQSLAARRSWEAE